MVDPPPVADASAVVPRLSRRPMMHLKTSSVVFAIWWVVLLLLHAVNVGYYVTAAVLYRSMRWANVTFQLATYSIGIPITEYYNVSNIHWIVAALHVLCMLAMILGSLQARRLMFLPTLSPWLTRMWAKPSAAIETAASTPPNQQHSGLRGRLMTLTRHVPSFFKQVVMDTDMIFGREGFLGVDGVYFDHLLLARELLETALQTIQVYRMSYLLPRVWLVRFYVALLIANCWSMPMLHRYYGNRRVDRRMMSLLCDAVLDMVSSIGVSFTIFATYAPQYTDPLFGFPFTQWFDDVWFTNMQQEFQMMLVVSWADMASRLVFAVGLLQCMESIKELLTPVKAKALSNPSGKIYTTAIVKPDADEGEMAQERHKTIGASKVKVRSPKPKKGNSSKRTRVINFLLEKAGPTFFVAFGFAIFVVHAVAETRQLSSQIPCQLQLHPWFVNKPACSLVELDCHQLGGLSGSHEAMEEAWNTYEFSATARLFVRHCPQLEVPSTLQHFHQLTSLKFYNSTIATWPKEAAFTFTHHGKMCAFFAIRTNFSNGELPPGLLARDFPQLRSFTTSTTNIHSLPDNLHELWPQTMALVFEVSLLQFVPPTVVKMNPKLLSFAGSPIVIVPAEMFEGPSLECVLLSYTLLQELPRVVANPSPWFYLMFLEGTNVSTFWSWMEPFVQYSSMVNKSFFTASGSRFCAERDAIVAGNRTSFSITTAEPGVADLASVMDVSTPEKLRFSQSAVLCERALPFYFPVGLQDATTAIHP
jgi:hypothetical protein